MIIAKFLGDGLCPNCGHGQFIVNRLVDEMYLTQPDGSISDYNETIIGAVGCCVRCGHRYPMIESGNKFVPITKLKAIILGIDDKLINI